MKLYLPKSPKKVDFGVKRLEQLVPKIQLEKRKTEIDAQPVPARKRRIVIQKNTDLCSSKMDQSKKENPPVSEPQPSAVSKKLSLTAAEMANTFLASFEDFQDVEKELDEYLKSGDVVDVEISDEERRELEELLELSI